MFQFLIGTLKTDARGNKKINGGVFQFLIGTLKTKIRFSELDIQIEVSIPHRYAKNVMANPNTMAVPVSIPHRYAKNKDGHGNEIR